ncbi:MAG TPA: hypothetical protein VM577_10780, partial [Anaerovoracaceae bacterium]|nr:hypothetical protein [Anaerovoracaceae bacterium]
MEKNIKPMTRQHYNLILDQFHDLDDHARFGLQLAGEFGLRAAEITHLGVKDIDFKLMLLNINSIGKSHQIQMTYNQMIWLLKEITRRGLTKNDHLVPLSATELQKHLYRVMEKARIDPEIYGYGAFAAL